MPKVNAPRRVRVSNNTLAANPYLRPCRACGAATSRAYAKTHDGQCKACADPSAPPRQPSFSEQRMARIIDCGYQAYAREEGHYDTGDR
jgi:hypothetical protein